MVRNLDMKTLWAVNGADGIAKTLNVSINEGVKSSELSTRQETYGFNKYTEKPSKSFLMCKKRCRFYDLVIGDIVHLSNIDKVPTDGIFISRYNLLFDESTLTGESDYVHISENKPLQYPVELARSYMQAFKDGQQGSKLPGVLKTVVGVVYADTSTKKNSIVVSGFFGLYLLSSHLGVSIM
ncbi:putative P-type Ca(2+) transporter [Helianthus anomalus]